MYFPFARAAQGWVPEELREQDAAGRPVPVRSHYNFYIFFYTIIIIIIIIIIIVNFLRSPVFDCESSRIRVASEHP